MEIVDVRNQLARHPSKIYSKRNLEAIKYLVIHHSATGGGDAFSFARYHVNTRDWAGIGYHYVILENGTIQWTNDISVISNHVKGYNSRGVGICLVGDFTSGNLRQEQKLALKELVKSLLQKLNLNIDAVVGHSELSGSTQCPALDMEILRQYLIEDGITVYVNNAKLDILGDLKDGITYIPLRAFAEALGYEVAWDENNRSVYLSKDDLWQQVKEEKDYYLSMINKIRNIVGGCEG